MDKLKILIGRNPQCDYLINNPEQSGTVSGKHATLSENDVPNTFLFEDHSTNGSYVNGKFVHNDKVSVSLNDHITLGRNYVLPLEEIVKRYFQDTRTTKKKPQPESQSTPPVNHSDPMARVSNKPIVLPLKNPYPEVPHVEAPQPTKVMQSYWILFAVSVIVAFVLGFFMAFLFI